MTLSREQRSEIYLTNIDTSDCAVIAIQAVTGLSRHEAEELALRHGYVPAEGCVDKRPGMPRGGINEALKRYGFTLRRITPDPGDTPATFSLCHEDGRYLVYIDKHVMALVEGDLHNSRGCWSDPVEEIYEVTK